MAVKWLALAHTRCQYFVWTLSFIFLCPVVAPAQGGGAVAPLTAADLVVQFHSAGTLVTAGVEDVYLLDAGNTVFSNFASDAFVVMAVSPQLRGPQSAVIERIIRSCHIHILYLPVLTVHEVQSLRRQVHPTVAEENSDAGPAAPVHAHLHWSKTQIQERFRKYGGIPRTLFSDPSDQSVERQLSEALDVVAELFPRIATAFAGGSLASLPMEASSMVLHYNVILPALPGGAGLPNPPTCFELDNTAPLAWASQFVTTRLALQANRSEWVMGAMRLFFSSLVKLHTHLPGLSADAFRGNLFEAHAQCVLYANKTGYLRRKFTWKTVQTDSGWQMQQSHPEAASVNNFIVQGEARSIETRADIHSLQPHQFGLCASHFGSAVGVDAVLHNHVVF